MKWCFNIYYVDFKNKKWIKETKTYYVLRLFNEIIFYYSSFARVKLIPYNIDHMIMCFVFRILFLPPTVHRLSTILYKNIMWPYCRCTYTREVTHCRLEARNRCLTPTALLSLSLSVPQRPRRKDEILIILSLL